MLRHDGHHGALRRRVLLGGAGAVDALCAARGDHDAVDRAVEGAVVPQRQPDVPDRARRAARVLVGDGLRRAAPHAGGRVHRHRDADAGRRHAGGARVAQGAHLAAALGAGGGRLHRRADRDPARQRPHRLGRTAAAGRELLECGIPDHDQPLRAARGPVHDQLLHRCHRHGDRHADPARQRGRPDRHADCIN